MPQGLTNEKVRELRPKIALMPPEDQRDMFSYAWNILILPKLDTKHLSQDDLDASREQYVTAMMGAVPAKLPETFGRPETELTTGQKIMTSPLLRPLERGVEGGIEGLAKVQQFQKKYLGLEDPEFARAPRLREAMAPVSEAVGEPNLAGKAMQLAGEMALPSLIAAPAALTIGAVAPMAGLGATGTAALAGATEGALTMPLYTGEIDPTQMGIGAVAGSGLGALGSKAGQYLTKRAATSAARTAAAAGSDRGALVPEEIAKLREKAITQRAGKAFTEADEVAKAKLNELSQARYPGRDFPFLNRGERGTVLKEFKAWQKATGEAEAAVAKDAEIIASSARKEAARGFKKRVDEYVRVSGKTPTVGDPAYEALKAGKDVFDITGQPRPVPKVKPVKTPTSPTAQASALEALQAEPSVAAATGGAQEAAKAVKPAIALAKGQKKGVRDFFSIGESEAERLLPLEQRIDNAITKLKEQTKQHFEDILKSDSKSKPREHKHLSDMYNEALAMVKKGDLDLTGARPLGKELPIEGMSSERQAAVSGGSSVTQQTSGDVEKTLVDMIDEQKVLLVEFEKLGKSSVAKQVMDKLERAAERVDIGTPADIGEVNEALRTVLEKLKGGTK